jgi:Sec7-like guanine-nucleotide exchange factor
MEYFRQNEGKGPFRDSDAVYSFTYLLFMLQTNLHNANVEEKMTLT